MSKSVLGRGLGSLMNGDKPAVSVNPATTTGSSPEQPAATGPGVSSLLQGKPRAGNSPFAASKPAPQAAKSLIPTWYLFAGDVLLVAFAILVAFRSAGEMSWKEASFCVTAVILGAALSLIGIVQRGNGRE